LGIGFLGDYEGKIIIGCGVGDEWGRFLEHGEAPARRMVLAGLIMVWQAFGGCGED
jgi:hypothetical protein